MIILIYFFLFLDTPSCSVRSPKKCSKGPVSSVAVCITHIWLPFSLALVPVVCCRCCSAESQRVVRFVELPRKKCHNLVPPKQTVRTSVAGWPTNTISGVTRKGRDTRHRSRRVSELPGKLLRNRSNWRRKRQKWCWPTETLKTLSAMGGDREGPAQTATRQCWPPAESPNPAQMTKTVSLFWRYICSTPEEQSD